MKLGILGGGQLARMLSLAAYPLGISTICLDPDKDACAGQVTDLIVGQWTDESVLEQLCAQVDCVTYETENIPLFCAEWIAKRIPLKPSFNALKMSQDRLYEKTFLNSLGIPTAPFLLIETEADLINAMNKLGFPFLVKTRTEGYDGKGQYLLKLESDIANFCKHLQKKSFIAEKFISFQTEFSIITVRAENGELMFYPLTQNHHHQGILRYSEASFDDSALQQIAQSYAHKITDHLNYVGVLAIEFFYDGKQLIVNEIAPRVHNSGHWTIEGAYTSQFENHLRAMFELPLGNTQAVNPSFMLNFIGKIPPVSPFLAISGVHYHTYGKAAKDNRKVGHTTLVDGDLKRYQESKKKLLKITQDHFSE